MRRRPSFRRDADLQAEVRRVNKLVQNKQSRLRVNKGLEVQGVETVRYTQFNSRREINRYLKQMNQFLEKKADFRVTNEKGTELHYSEVQQIERTINRVNRKKQEQWNKYKDLPYKHKGEPTGLTVEQVADPDIGIGHPKFADFKPIKFNPGRFRSEKEFRDWASDKERVYGGDWLSRRNESYRDNYLDAVRNNLGNDGDELYERVENMPLDEFMTMYYTENNANIRFVYDKVARNSKIKELNRIWGLGD